MASRRKRLFPRKMSSDYINTSQGVDKTLIATHDIFQNHERAKTLDKQLRLKGEKDDLGNLTISVYGGDVPPTKYIRDGKLIFNPRVKAIAKSLKERAATPVVDIGSVDVGTRMLKVSTWNKFKVCDGLWLYFHGPQWVFVKESRAKAGEIIYSSVYESKEKALQDIRVENGVLMWSRIFWAGERKI